MKGWIRGLVPCCAAGVTLLLVSCAGTGKKESLGPDLPQLQDQVTYEGPGTLMLEGKRSVSGKLAVEQSRDSSYVYSTFKIRKESTGVEVAGTGSQGASLKAAWPQGARFDLKLDPQKEYQVDLFTDSLSHEMGGRMIGGELANEVAGIRDKDRLLFDASVCRVHHVEMKRALEDYVGADECTRSFMLQREKSFPNDGVTYVGCGSGARYPIWKCPKCEAAFERKAKQQGIE